MLERHKQLRYVDAQFTVFQASYGGKYFTIQGSSTKTSDVVSKQKQFALNAVDSHGNTYVYKLYVTAQYLKFAIDLLTPVRAGVRRPWVETELTATKKSATDGN